VVKFYPRSTQSDTNLTGKVVAMKRIAGKNDS